MQFQKAQRKRAKLRLALSGPSGSGKTHSALLVAKGLGGRIAVIDTEHGSASLYSDLVEFDVMELPPPYTPERFIEAIRAANGAGYDICIIDSITHEWDGSGGCLELNEQIAQRKFKGNTWSAWSETTPRHRAFLDEILQTPMHVIATMRSKTETVQGDDKKVKKLGMKVVQREGSEYEFTVVLDLEHERHWATASKDRTRLFGEPHIITPETGRRLAQWLDSGAEPDPLPERKPVTPEPDKGHEPHSLDMDVVRAHALAMLGIITAPTKEGDHDELQKALTAFDYHTKHLVGHNELYSAAAAEMPPTQRQYWKDLVQAAKDAEKKDRAVGDAGRKYAGRSW